MIRTLKASFGLGLLAAVVMSLWNVMGASAITSGHFTSDVETTRLQITEQTGTAHAVQLHNLGKSITCHSPSYSAHLTGTAATPKTSQEIKVVPHYTNCTEGEENATINMNGCYFLFTSRTPPNHATVHFKCPVGKKAIVTSGGCETKFGEQTPSGGATYTTIVGANNKHAITVNVTASNIHNERHGICAIFGTTGTNAEMTGAVTVEGFDLNNNPVNITHT